jgi:hypothetical protein
MKPYNKAEKLLDIAGRTLEAGDADEARRVAVMALKQEDAVDALDKILPSINEPQFEAEEFESELSDQQVARIMSVAKELQQQRRFKIATQILAKIEKIEQSKKRKRKPTET